MLIIRENYGENHYEGKKIYSPYELFEDNDIYFIITTNNIATARLQLMAYDISVYGIFLNSTFHDFCDENKELQTVIMESINTICFEDEKYDSALPYLPSITNQQKNLGRLNFCLYSITWTHWVYLWEIELINAKKCNEVLEIGPGYGTMSLVLLKMFPQVHIDWMLMGENGKALEGSDFEFEAGLAKIKNIFKGRVNSFYGKIECDEIKGKKYDLIILTEVFEHFALNPVNTMKKIRNGLDTKGIIILTTPNWGYMPIYKTWEEMPNCEDISAERYYELIKCGHVYQYTKEELFSIFEQAGLRVNKYDLSDGNSHNFVLSKA